MYSERTLVSFGAIVYQNPFSVGSTGRFFGTNISFSYCIMSIILEKVVYIFTVSKFVNSSEPTISFSLPCPDWCLLQESPLWARLDKYLEACQSTDTQKSSQKRVKILETVIIFISLFFRLLSNAVAV